MRVGCDLPYFADAGSIRGFAAAAEELGYDHLGFSEHVAASRRTEPPPGFSFDDPWHESATLLGFLAAVTDRIELNTAMLLVTLRHPVLAAKQLAEVDVLCAGRLRVGVSVGWNRDEQLAVGVDPSTRGRRIEEIVPLLRRLWTEDAVTHSGQFFVLDEVGIHPRPARSIPIWMGAGGVQNAGEPPDAALRRAARLADGFKLMAPTGNGHRPRHLPGRATPQPRRRGGAGAGGRGAAADPVHATRRVGRRRPALPGVRCHHARRARQPDRRRDRRQPDRPRPRVRQSHKGGVVTTTHRAHHVGSLLRPPELLTAWRRHANGEVGDDELEAAQDAAIRDVVAMQEDAGLAVVTDGEFRRLSYWKRFVDAVDGLDVGPGALFVHGRRGRHAVVHGATRRRSGVASGAGLRPRGRLPPVGDRSDRQGDAAVAVDDAVLVRPAPTVGRLRLTEFVLRRPRHRLPRRDRRSRHTRGWHHPTRRGGPGDALRSRCARRRRRRR